MVVIYSGAIVLAVKPVSFFLIKDDISKSKLGIMTFPAQIGLYNVPADNVSNAQKLLKEDLSLT